MVKIYIFLMLVILGISIVGEPVIAEKEKPKSNEVQIILYKKGKQIHLASQTPYFQEVLQECEKLFLTADSGYRLVMSKERIEKIKKKQTALEVIYPEIQTGKVRNQLTVYFTRLLIPLEGEFSNGTVFFAGIHEYELKRDNPDLLPEQNYNYIDHYRGFNFVLNTKGLSRLKETLKKMSIELD